jgi:hypothetical protein
LGQRRRIEPPPGGSRLSGGTHEPTRHRTASSVRSDPSAFGAFAADRRKGTLECASALGASSTRNLDMPSEPLPPSIRRRDRCFLRHTRCMYQGQRSKRGS